MAMLDFITGSGDDAAAAEAERVRKEEAIRRVRQAQDRARINAMFGITDFDYRNLPDIFTEMGIPRPEVRKTTIPGLDPSTQVSGDYGGLGGAIKPLIQDQQLAMLDFEKEGINPLIPQFAEQEAAKNKASRENTLEGIYQDILNNAMYELDRQYARKGADVKAMLAGRGLSRSSVGQSVLDRLDEVYDTQETGMERTAQSAREKVRTADEQTRQDLLSMINQGGDFASARASGTRGLESNVQQAYDLANAQNLTNLFSAMDELYGQKQYVDAYNRGVRDTSPNIVTPGSQGGSSYSGTVVNY